MPAITRKDSDLHQMFSTGIQFDKNLSIYQHRQRIVETISSSSTVLIHGATGCGKTTQIPQYILDACVKEGQLPSIVVTQPRRIAAISVARHVCEERGWELGQIVGYQIGQDAKISDDNRIVYCTLGVFLQQLIHSKNLDRYTHIILDEIHEREEEMDLALLLIKRLRQNNSGGRQPKLIVMSATMEMEKLEKYLDNPPVIAIKDGMFPVIEKYIDDLPFIQCLSSFGLEDPFMQPFIQDGIVQLIIHLDDDEGFQNRGSVLIFVPGIREIKSIMNALESESRKRSARWEVLALHSTISTPEQQQIFIPVAPHKRRIIVASNIAESSITVPDVKFIVDLCLTKQLQRDESCSFTALQLAWASKSNCEQRKGRAGRVQAGTVFRMVPRAFYQNLSPHATPEILRIPLHQTILKIKKLGMTGTIYDILEGAIDPPTPADIKRSVLELMEAGALKLPDYPDSLDGDLTTFGQIMAQLPLDLALSRLIILSICFSCPNEGIIIAACLSSRNFMDCGFEKDSEKYRIKACLSEGKNCDLLAALKLYQTWDALKNRSYGFASLDEERCWCDQYCISPHRINEVSLLVAELKSRIDQLEVVFPLPRENKKFAGGWDQPVAPLDQTILLQFIIAGAFYPNFFFSKPTNSRNSPIQPEVNPDDMKTVILKTFDAKSTDVCPLGVKSFFHKNIGFEPEVVNVRGSIVECRFGEDEWRAPVPLSVRMALKLRDDRELKRIIVPVVYKEPVTTLTFAPRSVSVSSPLNSNQQETPESTFKAVEFAGPESEREIRDYLGLSRDIDLHHIVVNRSSINSVVVNTATSDLPIYIHRSTGIYICNRHLSRLLVAATVRSSSTGNMLFLDYTSLMPPIPGFAEWALLVFTPAVKLTMDQSGKYCVGMRGGLGKCLKKGSYLWKEHEFTRQFDVRLDRDHIKLAKLMRITIFEWCFAEHFMASLPWRRITLPGIQKNLLDQLTEMMTCPLKYYPNEIKAGGKEMEIDMKDVQLTWDDEVDSESESQ